MKTNSLKISFVKMHLALVMQILFQAADLFKPFTSSFTASNGITIRAGSPELNPNENRREYSQSNPCLPENLYIGTYENNNYRLGEYGRRGLIGGHPYHPPMHLRDDLLPVFQKFVSEQKEKQETEAEQKKGGVVYLYDNPERYNGGDLRIVHARFETNEERDDFLARVQIALQEFLAEGVRLTQEAEDKAKAAIEARDSFEAATEAFEG
jgi:truncated hemoglobin YjbI